MENNGKKLKIVMYTDITCPWCYLGMATMESLAKRYPIELEHIGVEIHPEFPEDGAPLNWSHPMLSGTLDNINERLKEYGLFLPKAAQRAYNTHKALIVMKYAKNVGKQEEYLRNMWDAFLLHGKNISDLTIIYEEAEKAGISYAEVNRALSDPELERGLAADQAKYNVTSVPTFIVDNKYLVGGAHEESVFEELFRKLGY